MLPLCSMCMFYARKVLKKNTRTTLLSSRKQLLKYKLERPKDQHNLYWKQYAHNDLLYKEIGVFHTSFLFFREDEN